MAVRDESEACACNGCAAGTGVQGIRTELRCVRRGTAFSPMGTAGTDHPLASARAQTHKTEDVHVELSGRSGW